MMSGCPLTVVSRLDIGPGCCQNSRESDVALAGAPDECREVVFVTGVRVAAESALPIVVSEHSDGRLADAGLVLPAEFIPVAEETGLIVAIGEWVLREACKEAARWPDPIKVAVNLSPVQFRNRGLVTTVTQALAAARLSPHRLELEITEAVLLQNDDMTVAMLHTTSTITTPRASGTCSLAPADAFTAAAESGAAPRVG